MFETYSQKTDGPIPLEVIQPIPNEFLARIGSAGKPITNHSFSNEDESLTVNLTQTFMALATGSYSRWEDFRNSLELPLTALRDVYSPRTYTRIGLRYIDTIKRAELGLADMPWRDLLQPDIIGTISSDTVGDSVSEYGSRSLISLADNQGKVQLVTALTLDEHGEECFVIDMDFFHEGKVPDHEVSNRLEAFRTSSNRMFQWCMKKPLFDALGPKEI